MDVGLALDLIDLVNQNPKDQDAPTNLNNACVVYEKLFQFGEATKCYERLAQDYPQSNLAKDASGTPRATTAASSTSTGRSCFTSRSPPTRSFANYEHRKDALGLAAQLLDNDQQYGRAADFYKRYSDTVPGQATGRGPGLLRSPAATTRSCATRRQRAAVPERPQPPARRPARSRRVRGQVVHEAGHGGRAERQEEGHPRGVPEGARRVRLPHGCRRPARRRPQRPRPNSCWPRRSSPPSSRSRWNSAADPEAGQAHLRHLHRGLEGLWSTSTASVWEYKDATWTLAPSCGRATSTTSSRRRW